MSIFKDLPFSLWIGASHREPAKKLYRPNKFGTIVLAAEIYLINGEYHVAELMIECPANYVGAAATLDEAERMYDQSVG